MASRGFLGAGDLYIARYNPATAQFDAFKGPYEASKFEIKPNVEMKEMASKGRNTYGQVIESVALPQPVDFTVEMPEVNKESLALALLGTESAINVIGAALPTDHPITAKKGAWFDIGYQNITKAGFTVKDETGVTTYVENTDYIMNWRMGWIQILEGSAIVEGATLEVNGSYGSISGTKLAGATQSQVRAKFRLDGINFADQLPVIVDCWEAIIAADAAFDFLADDFNTVSLPGRLKTPAGKTNPFEVQLLSTAI